MDEQKHETGHSDIKEESDEKRKRKMTEKGLSFSIDTKQKQVDSVYKQLHSQSETIRGLLTEASVETVRQKYHAWLTVYEQFLVVQSELLDLVAQSENESPTPIENQKERLTAFKHSMETWFETQYAACDKQRRPDSVSPDDSVSKTSKQRSRASAGSKRSSRSRSIASVRLEEERRRAELSARADALKQRRDLELAKLEIKLKEEELQIKTEIAVVDAKAEILDKFEKLDLDSQTSKTDKKLLGVKYTGHKDNLYAGDTVEGNLYSDNKPNVTSLNENIQTNFQPHVPMQYMSLSNVADYRADGRPSDAVAGQIEDGARAGAAVSRDGGCALDGGVGGLAGGVTGPGATVPGLEGERAKYTLSTGNSVKPLNPDVPQFVPRSFSGTQQQVAYTGVENAFLSVVNQMRKPVSEIRKFDGDPLEFKRFIRQFNTRVIELTETDEERINSLDQYTTGEANRIVSGYAYLDAEYGYPAAIRELTERYGNDDIVANAFVRRALDWNYGKPNDPTALDKYAVFLAECNNALKGIPAVQVLEYPENMRRLVQKLPFHLHDKWRSIVQAKRDRHEVILFDNLVGFVKGEARKANDPTYGREALSLDEKSPQRSTNPINQRKPRGVYAAVPVPDMTSGVAPKTTTVGTNTNTGNVYQGNKTTDNKPCDYCKKSHTLETCNKILEIKYDDRINFLKSRGLCYGCLKYGHMANVCRNRSVCSICEGKHPRICHNENRIFRKDTSHRDDQTLTKEASVREKTASACVDMSKMGSHMGAGSGDCTMAIIPVRVKLKNSPHDVVTYAFLDPGSSLCFCSEDLMSKLGGTGPKLELKLSTMGESHILRTRAISGLQVYDLEMQGEVNLPKVYTKEAMPVTRQHIPTESDIQQWHHLRDVRLPLPEAEIGLLIGNNVPDAYTPADIKTGPKGSPHATRTSLGWVVWNVVRDNDGTTHGDVNYSVNRAEIQALREIDGLKELDMLIKRSMNSDFPERKIDDKKEHSVEDKRFLAKVQDSMVFRGGHYEIGLPFRKDDILLPDNRDQAMARLKGLETKLRKDHALHRDYTAFMEDILDKQYAEAVPDDEVTKTDGRVWYIPHHGVYHPRKPEKIRVVFDCSATYMGVSLNDQLLPGPDLTNNLLGVLLRFRQEQVAVVGDVEAMFYQVNVPEADRDFLRFYWWPKGNLQNEPKEFRMRVHLFGAFSSPSCSNAALRQTANDNGKDFEPEVVEVVKKCFYVDDCVTSTSTEEKAISLIKGLSAICQQGGFHLTKWTSSSHSVLETVPKSERAKGIKELDLEHQDLPNDRALGVYWHVESDKLGFKIVQKNQPQTRRGILSTICSVYDPLGLAAPVVLSAKIILQSLCKQNIGWDDQIPENDQKKWQQWVTELPLLENLQVNRSYKPEGFGEVVQSQLHVFCDASDVGYGIAIYMRTTNDRNEVNCSLVFGKARVAPLKKVTVPRMELTAAALAVRLAKMVTTELDLDIQRTIYWTDSMSVIRYVSNETTRFQTFVANRVTTIREASEPHDWQHVESALNPADMASRGARANSFMKSALWFQGPPFLCLPEDQWPITDGPSRQLCKDDSELKKVVNTTVVREAVVGKLLRHCSSWEKVKTLVGWLIVVKAFLRKLAAKRKEISEEAEQKEPDTTKRTVLIQFRRMEKKAGQELTIGIIGEAEELILRQEQQVHLLEEYLGLQAENGSVKRSSSLRKLNPVFLNGLIRVGGRLGRAELPYDTKHPIVLPKLSLVSTLILQSIHKEVGHLGRNAMLTKLQEKYWLPGANTMIKTIVRKCVTCRKYQAPVGEQKMADLPQDRVTPNEPPFSRVGIDFWGPHEVRRGRSIVKRYGVLFTCLATRAIHLEVAHSLTTDSCIHAIRRFIARRGPVQNMRSDNGTNLVGAEKELREEISKWNHQKLHQTMLRHNIVWEFNPPTGSHFGGAWERMIRTVRKVMYALLREQRVNLDDESLQTLLCEAEAIVNGRPLTKVSSDPHCMEPLTPNHLLLQRAGDSLPPGIFVKSDNYARRQWRQVQYLADQFWKRWSSEYLHLLQERQKWTMPKRNLQVGDVVLLVESTPRNSWCMGRVTETIADKKGFVRMVQVRTKSNTLLRPIDKLCLILESEE